MYCWLLFLLSTAFGVRQHLSSDALFTLPYHDFLRSHKHLLHQAESHRLSRRHPSLHFSRLTPDLGFQSDAAKLSQVFHTSENPATEVATEETPDGLDIVTEWVAEEVTSSEDVVAEEPANEAFEEATLNPIQEILPSPTDDFASPEVFSAVEQALRGFPDEEASSTEPGSTDEEFTTSTSAGLDLTPTIIGAAGGVVGVVGVVACTSYNMKKSPPSSTYELEESASLSVCGSESILGADLDEFLN